LYEKLISDYQDYLKWLAYRYKHHNYQDIYQQGVMLLIEAHKKGVKNIKTSVCNGIRKYCRDEQRYQDICKGGDSDIK
jgi:hypothetical protein